MQTKTKKYWNLPSIFCLFIDFISCISDEAKEEVDLGSSSGEKVCLFEITVFKLNFKKKSSMLVTFNGDNFSE